MQGHNQKKIDGVISLYAIVSEINSEAFSFAILIVRFGPKVILCFPSLNISE